jgi:hypothetical protein
MALFSCNVIIEGYWRKMNRHFIPNFSGIFFVYLASYNKTEDTITPDELIFVGHGWKIREQIERHVQTDNPWLPFQKPQQEFCFSAAYISELDMERVASAFIYYFKPPANNQYKDSFTYDPTTITVTGKTARLKSQFTVQKTSL